MSGSGGVTPASRRHDAAELLPLFSQPTSGSASPSGMGTLKHRAGGSLGDILVPSAAGDDASKAPGAGAAVTPSPLAPAVVLCVAVASMGAFCFGYHLGVVNGPLEVMSQQLGFGGDAFLQGLVSGSGFHNPDPPARLHAHIVPPHSRFPAFSLSGPCSLPSLPT